MLTPSPLEQMDRILTSYCILQAVGVVARLGIADRIADRSQSLSELALETSVNELALHRLLRMLVAMDVPAASVARRSERPCAMMLRAR